MTKPRRRPQVSSRLLGVRLTPDELAKVELLKLDGESWSDLLRRALVALEREATEEDLNGDGQVKEPVEPEARAPMVELPREARREPTRQEVIERWADEEVGGPLSEAVATLTIGAFESLGASLQPSDDLRENWERYYRHNSVHNRATYPRLYQLGRRVGETLAIFFPLVNADVFFPKDPVDLRQTFRSFRWR